MTLRRQARGFLLAGVAAVLALSGAPEARADHAALPLWFSETTMRDSEFLRHSFVINPGVGSTITHGRFAGEYRGFFEARGFDPNFLLWAPIETLPTRPAERWTACASPGNDGGVCPASRVTLSIHTPEEEIREGGLTVKIWNGTWIAVVCGNYNRSGAGPIPRIQGTKYNDLNRNGHRDAGEPGVAGWEMQLYFNGALIATTTTDGNGFYRFLLDARQNPPIRDGNFDVREAGRANWTVTEQPQSQFVPLGVGQPTYTRNSGSWENRPPTVSAGGPYEVPEGGSVIVSADGSDPEGQPLSYAWDLDGDGTFETSGQSVVFPAHTLDGPSSRTITVRATDDHGLTAQELATVDVLNVAPTATLIAPASVNEASTIELLLVDPSDPSTADMSAGFAYAFDCGDGSGYGSFGPDPYASCSTDDNGTRTVRAQVRDKDGGATAYEVDVRIENVAPTARLAAPSPLDEGSAIAVAVTDPRDPSAADTAAGFTYAFDCDDGSGYSAFGASATASCSTADDGIRNVRGMIRDKDGGTTEYTAPVEVRNVSPACGPVSAPLDPNTVGTLIVASAAFTDPGTADTHTAVIDWGDGTTAAAAVTESGGSGTATGVHTYTAAGIYTLVLTVSDDDDGSGSCVFQFVVIYDPGAGFVTGGGWISSPRGAYAADPELTGRASFGFVSKYLRGATTPSGNTEFQFHAARLNFHSRSYDWLVVPGARAQFRGTGTINGEGAYDFSLTAIDGQTPGGSGIDRFRIKIWDRANGGLVYDNETGLADNGDPTTALGGGSITIHR